MKSDHVKYPSTKYLPFSPGHKEGHEDTMSQETFDNLRQVPLVVTTKMDGSNVKLTSEYVASRAGHEQSASHPSFDYLKSLWNSTYRWAIPEGIVVFGEWLHAAHSIHYKDDIKLDSYLQVFSAYDPVYRLFLGWDEVQKIASDMGVPTTPIVAQYPANTFKNAQHLQSALENEAWKLVEQGHEGLVVRSAYPFHYGHFQTWLAKWVRPNHIQTTENWSQQKMVKNEVRK